MLARAVALVNRSCTRQHTEREGVAVVSALHRSMCDSVLATWAFLPEEPHGAQSAAPKLTRLAASEAQGSPRRVLRTHGCR